MSTAVVLISFPIVFVGELPDKTMFASLLMATRGRPLQVWLGAAAAFAVHVAFAVTVGASLWALLPRRVVDVVVAAAFLAGALLSWRASASASASADAGLAGRVPTRRGAVLGAFAVVFVAEWGDLTQILTADLAARYGDPLSVAVGAGAALWAVAALAVTGGRALLRVVSVRRIRQLTAVVLVGLAGLAAWSAAAAT